MRSITICIETQVKYALHPQAFIVIVADVALIEDEDTDNSLKRRTKVLAAHCQRTGYSDLAGCLTARRGLYVDLWCPLIEVQPSFP